MKNANPLPPDWLLPDWPAIPGVFAVFTSRNGGVSQAPWDSLNLGDHVGDAPQAVMSNRQLFAAQLEQLAACPVTPHFLQQVHGVQVCQLPLAAAAARAFDACVSNAIGQACTIMVADCLPVLLAHRSGHAVAAAHAGWRGLAGPHGGQGVLEAVFKRFCLQVQSLSCLSAIKSEANGSASVIAQDTLAWLGPCIGPQAFEVGEEVVRAFIQAKAQAEAYFLPGAAPGKWQADLAALARQRWQALGIDAIYGNDSSTGWCTVANPSRFFSHRRDSGIFGSTGRMAAAIVRTV